MSSYHYLYRITNLVEQKHYYGIRTTKNTLPQHDLGIKYFSSSHDKEFLKDQREHPENYKYKVIIVTNSRKKVVELEIKLHKKFNVGINPKFYNKSIQTSTGFDASGTLTMMDDDGNCSRVVFNDPKIESENLVGVNKGLRWAYHPEINKNILLKPNDPLPNGFIYGMCTTTKAIYWISNIKLKKTRMLKPGEALPEGWEYGRLRFGWEKLGTTTKGYTWVNNSELKKNTYLKPGEEIPEGWQRGMLKQDVVKPGPIKKGSKRIYNTDLKQNRIIKPDENLPEGWQYGMKNFNGTLPSTPKGSRKIFNLTLKQNTVLKPGESLPEGWQYGMKNFNETSLTTKGSKWIHNLELKKNTYLKPGEELLPGWKFGQKRTWD